jgi:hypothetical protein
LGEPLEVFEGGMVIFPPVPEVAALTMESNCPELLTLIVLLVDCALATVVVLLDELALPPDEV